MFLLLLMALENPLIFKIQLKLFQKQYNSLIKKVFLTLKGQSTQKGEVERT